MLAVGGDSGRQAETQRRQASSNCPSTSSSRPTPSPFAGSLRTASNVLEAASMMAEDMISNASELRDHRHLLASLKHAHTRSLSVGLLSTLARPRSVSRVDDAPVGNSDALKEDATDMDIDSGSDIEAPLVMRVLEPPISSRGPSPPLQKVHDRSHFTLFPVHISQLPPPPTFSLPEEILAIANGHLRSIEPPSEVLPPHVGPLVAASVAFLDNALLAVADATSPSNSSSELTHARSKKREREAEEGGWVRVVQAMQMLQIPEKVKRRTLERLASLYGPAPALHCESSLPSHMLQVLTPSTMGSPQIDRRRPIIGRHCSRWMNCSVCAAQRVNPPRRRRRGFAAKTK